MVLLPYFSHPSKQDTLGSLQSAGPMATLKQGNKQLQQRFTQQDKPPRQILKWNNNTKTTSENKPCRQMPVCRQSCQVLTS